jgi:hypothetical protein
MQAMNAVVEEVGARLSRVRAKTDGDEPREVERWAAPNQYEGVVDTIV